MHIWPRRRITETPPSSALVHQPEPRPEPIEHVELVFTSDELGGLEARLRATLPGQEVGGLRTPATLASAVRQVTADAGPDLRIEVHRLPAALKAGESWEIVLWDVPGVARERLSNVLGRTI